MRLAATQSHKEQRLFLKIAVILPTQKCSVHTSHFVTRNSNEMGTRIRSLRGNCKCTDTHITGCCKWEKRARNCRIFQTIRCTPPPNLGGKWGCLLQSECSLPGLLGGGRWSGVTGGRSRVTAAGSWGRQEWGDAAGPGLGGRGVLAVPSKGGRSGVPL